MDESRIYLVRHGQVNNPRRIAYGFLPRIGLSSDGHDQARRVAGYLAGRGPVALFSSPLMRAVQTARVIHAAVPRLPVHRSWLVRESELARVWQGTPIDDRAARFPEEYRRWMESPASSTAGETLAAQAERMRRALTRATRRYPRGPLIVVSHRDPILALRLTAEGRSLEQLHTTRCEPGSITILARCDGRLAFVGYVEP